MRSKRVSDPLFSEEPISVVVSDALKPAVEAGLDVPLPLGQGQEDLRIHLHEDCDQATMEPDVANTNAAVPEVDLLAGTGLWGRNPGEEEVQTLEALDPRDQRNRHDEDPGQGPRGGKGYDQGRVEIHGQALPCVGVQEIVAQRVPGRDQGLVKPGDHGPMGRCPGQGLVHGRYPDQEPGVSSEAPCAPLPRR